MSEDYSPEEDSVDYTDTSDAPPAESRNIGGRLQLSSKGDDTHASIQASMEYGNGEPGTAPSSSDHADV